MWLFLLFVAVPLIEIALFIQIGGWLTLWPTLALVLITAMIGTALVRRQGLRVLHDAQRALEELGDPLAPLAHGAMILFAGALLLTPGFLTDALGFALLVPAVRMWVLRWALRNRVHVTVFGRRAGSRPDGATRRRSGPRPDGGHVIDAEYRDVTPQSPAPDDDAGAGRRSSSPWHREGERH
jgi:UPF0716 protein FxsA